MSAVFAPPRRAQLPPTPDGGSVHDRLRRTDGGRLTLEQRLDRVWEGLFTAGAAECPVCHASMERAGDAARCGGCGTTLT